MLGVPGLVVYCPANHQNPNRQVELGGIGRGSVLRIFSEDDRECQVFDCLGFSKISAFWILSMMLTTRLLS